MLVGGLARKNLLTGSRAEGLADIADCGIHCTGRGCASRGGISRLRWQDIRRYVLMRLMDGLGTGIREPLVHHGRVGHIEACDAVA